MRKPRFLSIGVTGLFHKIWRGHNREFVLQSNLEKHHYLNALLNTFSDNIKQNVKLHGYCLMGNHSHEVGRTIPDTENSLKKAIATLGDWMRNAHSRFGAGYNRRHNRQGKVAYDRPKTSEIENEWEVLKVMFYCDANPVRAGLVSHPSRYRHSSHSFYAYGKKSRYTELLIPPEAYMALGKTAEERRKKYRQLCDWYLRQQGLIQDRPSEEVEALEEPWDFESMLYSIRIRGAP